MWESGADSSVKTKIILSKTLLQSELKDDERRSVMQKWVCLMNNFPGGPVGLHAVVSVK